MIRVVLFTLLWVALGVGWYFLFWAPDEPEVPAAQEKEQQEPRKAADSRPPSSTTQSDQPSSDSEPVPKPSESMPERQPPIKIIENGKLKPSKDMAENAARFHWLLHVSGPGIQEDAFLYELQQVTDPTLFEQMKKRVHIEEQPQKWKSIMVSAIRKEKNGWVLNTTALVDGEQTSFYLKMEEGEGGKWMVKELLQNPYSDSSGS